MRPHLVQHRVQVHLVGQIISQVHLAGQSFSYCLMFKINFIICRDYVIGDNIEVFHNCNFRIKGKKAKL